MTDTMQAMVFEHIGKPLQLRALPMPAVKPKQVLVRVAACGLNPLDLKIQAGEAAHAQVKLPAILGLDLAGTVVAVGEGAQRFRVGDDVYGMTGGVGACPGGLAQYAAVDESLLARKPRQLSMREAAAMPLIAITAWEGLIDRAQAKRGDKVLVQGGAGGVGHIVVQLAQGLGALVTATGSTASRTTIEGYGARFVDYSSVGAQQELTAETDSQGFDVVYDTVGGKTLDASLPLVRRYTGHVVSCLGWGTHALAPLSFRGASYSGVFALYPLLSGEAREAHGEILTKVAVVVDRGELRPLVDEKVYGLVDVNEAYGRLRDGSGKGKVVIEV